MPAGHCLQLNYAEGLAALARRQRKDIGGVIVAGEIVVDLAEKDDAVGGSIGRRLAFELGAQGTFADYHQPGVNFGHRLDEKLYALVVNQPSHCENHPRPEALAQFRDQRLVNTIIVELPGVDSVGDQMAAVGVHPEGRRGGNISRRGCDDRGTSFEQQPFERLIEADQPALAYYVTVPGDDERTARSCEQACNRGRRIRQMQMHDVRGLAPNAVDHSRAYRRRRPASSRVQDG